MVAPVPDKSHPAWQRAEREQRFWREHYQEYLERYPDQFVAVHDGRVIATSRHLRELVALVRGQGLKPTDVWVRFLAKTPRRILV